MDDSTKKIAQVLATGLVKKGLIWGGAALAGKGIALGFTPIDYTAAAGAIVATGWSFWQDYGKAILLSKVEVWKAEALAQAAALRKNGIATPTVTEIAAQHPTLTIADVAKVAATTASVLLVAVVLLSSAAHAQSRNRQPFDGLTGNPIEDVQKKLASQPDRSAAALDNLATALAKPFKDIADFIGSDADGAVKLATVLPNLQDGHGQQCWIAMQSFGDVIKAHPVPITFHVIQDYETLRLLGMATNNLCSNVHCTQVFADFTAMAQAASPMPLAIPSLHDLCTKVPQIAVVAPVAVPSPPSSPDASPSPQVTPIPLPAPSPSK